MSKQLEEYLRTALTSIGHAVISTDAQGRIVFTNSVVLSMLRATENEVTGTHVDEFFDIQDELTRSRVENPFRKALDKGLTVDLGGHTVLIARDGTETPIDGSAAPIRTEDGELQGVVLVFRDITARRRAEATQRLLASVVESSDDAIISKDVNGIVTTWNSGAERVFGYSAKEMIGKSIAVIAAPDRVDEMPRILERIKRGERIDPYETIRKAKDGSHVNISLTVSPIYDEKGRIVGASKIARDITDRLRVRVQLSEERERLRVTLNSIGDGVITTDDVCRVAYLNPVAQELTGWQNVEAVGRPLEEVFRIINEDSRQTVENPASKVLREGIVVGLANHTLLISRDGKERPIDDSGAPIKNEAGRIAGVVLVFRDVTDRRRAQREIERSERRHRIMFENNPQPMWVFHTDTLAFLAVNNAAVRNYGYSHEEFLRMTLKDIRPMEEIPALLEDIRHGTSDFHTDGPWHHRRKDGSLIAVEIIVHPLDFDGRPARLVLANDITERKKLEEQFHQAQRLESVGRLAGGVAHDFNNLLTVINGYSEMAMNDLAASAPVQRYLEQIAAAGAKAVALTQQLLAFSRKQIIQPTVLDLNAIVSEMEMMLRRLIGEHIQLVTQLASDLGRVKADAGQIQQVIMNLAVNARDAMPDGGSLHLETANVELTSGYVATHPQVRAGDYVMIAVTDTGTGMTDDVKARLFEPFFTTKPQGSGTGLGLATVFGMVKQNHGWIWVYSEVGRGTTFKIYLPRTHDEVAQPRVVIKSEMRGSETILIVEDQEDVRTLTVEALQRLGYTILSAASGEEALSLAAGFTGEIDLLLTDVVMPGMTGRRLADELAISRPEVRVLFMSGYTENAIAHQAVLDAGVAYLQKPFTPDSLAEKVRGVLG